MLAPTGVSSRAERFFHSVLWNWLGVAVNLIIAIAIAPYIVRKLGDEAYGIWMLVQGLIDYYWLLDFGFRSATVKYSAHYLATGEPTKINEVVNTALAYASVASLVLLGAAAALSRYSVQFFQISASHHGLFVQLILLVSLAWALGIVFNMFGACLEGFQRFDMASSIWIVTNTIRALGSLAVLAMGYGLLAMAAVVVASQVLSYVLSYVAVRRVFPSLQLSRRLVRTSVMRQMARYGVNTFLASIGQRSWVQGPPLLIGHFLPPAFVGYYTLPWRLVQYCSDIVMRVGAVSGSSTSELYAKKDTAAIARLGIYVNRYCLTMFLPVAFVLWLYAHQIITVWINPEFAARSAPLLPVLTLAFGIAVAGQFNTTSIMYGIGNHGAWARGLLVEVAVMATALFWAIPRYGILGAAWVVCICMLLNRAVWVPIVLCRSLNTSLASYLGGIYIRPVLTSAPALVIGWTLKNSWLPGRNIVQLLGASVILAILCYLPAYFFCLEPDHRKALRGAILRRLIRSREPAMSGL